MPLDLTAPLLVNHNLEETDRHYGVEGEPTLALFRQAGKGENDSLKNLRYALFDSISRASLFEALKIIMEESASLIESGELRDATEVIGRLESLLRNTAGLVRKDGSNQLVIFDFSRIEKQMVFITMAGCNITHLGKPVFKFKNEKLAMTFEEFVVAWNNLPDLVANDLIKGVFKANPDWAPEGEASSGTHTGDSEKA